MDSPQEHLLYKVERVLRRLDQTLAKIDNYRPLLGHHYSCAEFEIRANFDSLIGALNQRQLHLLKQLNEVYKEKLLLIENHKQSVDKLRTGLRACFMTKCIDDARAHDLLSRAEFDLENYVSDPFISFRNDHSTLPQAIASYGRVVSRYGGHFAIPGQPSSCLPLEMEEEEDYPDDSRDHSTICSRVSSTCTCVKPDLQKWLGKFHECNRKHKNADSVVRKLHSVLSAPISHQSNNKRMLYRTWLNVQSYKRSNESAQCTVCPAATPSTCTSEPTVGTESGSFCVLTDSANSPSDSLRDWLFCDPHVHLRDMPGLSSSIQMSSIRMQPNCDRGVDPHGDLSNWLVSTSSEHHGPTAITSQASTDSAGFANVTRSSLLPAHLTQSSPMDINRWLHQDQLSISLSVEPSIDNDQTERSPEDVTSEPMTIDPVVPDCCIYTQCRGGPGGPTCCGARLACAKASEQSVSLASRDNSSIPTTTDASSKSVVSMQSVASQSSHIVSTPLCRWLTKNSLDCTYLESSEEKKDSSHPSIDGKWLHPSTTNSLGKTTSQAEDESCGGFTLSIKRPNVSRTDLPIGQSISDQTGCDKIVNTGPALSRCPGDYECWLLKKMSNLSTAVEISPVDGIVTAAGEAS